jgi:ClpP class serine protease
MDPGEEIKLLLDQRPHPNQLEFLEHLVRDIAWGLGCSPDILWNIAKLGGATARYVMADAQQTLIEPMQELLADQFCSRFWVYYIAKEMKAGRLMPCQDPEWWKHGWQPQQKLTVDITRDGKLYVDMHKSGMISLKRYHAALGQNWQQETDEYLDERVYIIQGVNSRTVTVADPANPGKTITRPMTMDEAFPPQPEEIPAFPRPSLQQGAGVAIIPVYGIIGKRLSFLELFCGGCDLEVICEMLTQADEDADVHTIILDFDSPGGLYTGLPEAAKLIAGIATRKTVISFTDTQCCSAAYWLGSQANEFYCTQSSTIGSVGGFIAAIDTSEEWAKTGWVLELFKSGTLKAMGLDGKKWEQAERDFLQALVDKETGEFRDTVVLGRGPVAASTMQGQYFDGDQALPLNLVDGLVDNIQQVIDAALAAHYMAAAALVL